MTKSMSVWKIHALTSCSLLALAAFPAIARADCSPNPAQAYGGTICTGTETNGLTLSVPGVTANVNAGATVSAPTGSSAITVEASPPGEYQYLYDTLNISGAVNGGSQSGILVYNSTPEYSTSATVTVNSGGVVRGAYGIQAAGDANQNYSAGSSVQLTNSGTISGTSGYALYAPNPNTGSFSVTNMSGGQIGAIYGSLNSVNNAGVIDGGSSSAIIALAPSYGYSATITNSTGGVIRSNSAAAALVLDAASNTLANTGTITNTGAGPAIYAASGLSLTNVGGVINGPIIVDGSASSTIDDTGGVINGSINLSGGNNRVIAGFGTVADPILGVTGSINAGVGFNVLQLNFSTNTTLTSLIVPPATFGQVTYGIGPGSTLTIASPANPTSTIFVSGLASGAGTLVNTANIVTGGPAISADINAPYYYGVSFVNNGNITETSSSAYSISTNFYVLGSITNKGSITANGGGVYTQGSNFTNTGSIRAGWYGVNAFDAFISNSGSITSNGGIGIYALGNVGTPARNTGTIYGQVAGLQLDGYYFTNSGTISSPNVGILLGFNSSITNRSGGIINGGIGPEIYGFTASSSVTNSGVINGDVNLGSVVFDSNNRFIAQPGSILNGNLTLGGGGDAFATSLINTGPGAFAGVTGTVTGGGLDSLRYFVTSNAMAEVTLPPLFDALTYDLSGGAKLILTAPNPPVSTLDFAGTGSVDLAANLTGAGTTAILDLTQASLQTQGASATTVPTVLNFISRGTLTQISNASNFVSPDVLINGSSTFTNAGTIIAEESSAPYYDSQMAAISGSGKVINTGTIRVGLATAILGPSYNYGSTSNLTVLNSGSILQVGRFGDAEGVVSATSVTNTGTISTGGNAVVLGAGYNSSATLTNSGLIQSVDSPAVSAGYGVSANVDNQAGGVITGPGAISIISAGSVENAGVINGDVSVGSFYYSSTPNVYINDGGVLEGNLTFGGYGGAVLVPFNGLTGVTGAITTGGGVNTIAIPFTSNTTITDYSAGALEGPSLSSIPGFTGVGIGAVGPGVTVTLANVAGGLTSAPFLFGDGAIINNANINGAALQLGFGALEPYSSLQFTNNANLPGGVTGFASSFTNNGSIGSTAVYQTAVSLTAAAGASFTFSNTGGIGTESGNSYYEPPQAVSITGSPQDQLFSTVSIQNSGNILGGIGAGVISTNFSFDNSGNITGGKINSGYYYDGNYGAQLTVGQAEPTGYAPLDINGTLATLTNSGQISNGFSAEIAANATTFTNSGVISLNPGPSAAVSLTITGHQTNDPTQGVNGLIDQANLTVSNSGTINGAVAITSAADQVVVANTGAITAANYTGATPAVLAALGVNNTTSQAQAVSVTNAGTIASDNVISPGLSVIATSSLSTTAVSVSNSGVLRADFGGVLTPAVTTTTPVTPPALAANAGLAAIAASPTGSPSSVTITNAQGGLIFSMGPLIDGSTNTGLTLQGSTAGQGSAAVFAVANTVSITNSGQINGGAGLALATGTTTTIAGQSVTLADQYLAGAVQVVAGSATLNNTASGVINGSIDLGPGANTLNNYGVINGDLHLSGTTVAVVEGVNATLSGAVYAGTGANSLTVDVTGGGTLNQALFTTFGGFPTIGLTGAGTAALGGSLSLGAPTLTLAGGANLTVGAGQTLSTASNLTLSGVGGDTLTNAGTIAGGVTLSGGVNQIVDSGVIGGPITFAGASTNTLTLRTGGSVGGAVSGSAASGATNALVLQGSGTAANSFANFNTLTVQGSGVWTLSGASSIGATTVTGGALDVTGALASAFNINAGGTLQGSTTGLLAQGGVTDNGTLVFVQSADGVFANAINGAGALIKQNSGALTLSGAGTVATTTVQGGTLNVTGVLNSAYAVNSGGVLIGSVASLQAQGAVTDNGVLAFNQPSDATFANAVAGTGGLLKMGSGDLTLTGPVSVTSTEVAGGALTVQGTLNSALLIDTGATLSGDTGGLLARGTVTDNGTMVFAQATDGVFGGSIMGLGALVKQNAGLLVLNGASMVTTTTVSAGDLQIGDAAHPSAVLESAVTVNPGAILSGHGTIIGSVTNSGTVSPGGSIGVLTIQGNYTQTATGALSLQVTPQGGSVLQITGTAHLGGELVLVTDPGVYRKGQAAALISAGSITGNFAGATTSDGLALDLSFTNGVAMASFASSNFAVSGGTANQRAIGAAFANYPVGISDFDPVASAVIALPSGRAQNAALDALGGEVQADFLTVGRDNMRLMLDSVGEQLSIDGLADADGRSAAARRVWGKVYGEFGTVNGDAGGHGYNHSLGGGVAGVQYDLGSKSVGAAISYSHTNFSLRDLAQSGQLDAGTVAVDAEQRWGGLFLDGAASVAYDHGSGVRHVDFAGVGRRATGGFDGYATGLSATMGWRFKTAFGMVLEPSVGVALSHVRQDGLIETGATGADLADSAQAQGAAQTTIGVRFSKAFVLKQGRLSLEGRVAETNELGAVRPLAQESFAAAPGTDFALGGGNPGRDATVVGAGAVLDPSTRLSFFGRVQTSFSPRQHDEGFNLGGRLAW